MTRPRTSPIAQPVRQCQVAANAVRLSDGGSSIFLSVLHLRSPVRFQAQARDAFEAAQPGG